MRRFAVLALIGGAALAEDSAGAARRLLARYCTGCHGPSQQMKSLRLDRHEDVLKVVTPGRPDSSLLIRVLESGAKPRMPMGLSPLAEGQVAVLRKWIAEGAAWSGAEPRGQHWSFRPLRRPPVPPGEPNPVDAFIRARLRQEGVEPSPEAPRTTLARRVHLDLTGLPPSPDDLDAFLADTAPGAYERLVDRLLASPHFGEKWARHWLDLARFADSEGGIQDFVRKFAWRYRDWVIDSFNRDQPFDQFTIEQLAGDLLPQATVAQRTGAGFHRNTVTSREGGIELARLRFEQLVDRVSTTGTVWLGLTLGCAQCHDHKYDPISQREFYRLLALWENTEELDMEAPLAGELERHQRYVDLYREQRQKLIAGHGIVPALREWEEGVRHAVAHPGQRVDWDVVYDKYSKVVDHGPRILHTPPGKRTEREEEALTDYFLKNADVLGSEKTGPLRLKELSEKLAGLREKYPPLSTIMTFEERAERHPTHVRRRGNYDDRAEEVRPGALSFLNGDAVSNRLELARWLVSRDNPLPARVAVNRLWHELFGRGLSRTTEDLGAQGEKPSHPELLDWLAAEFMDRGWSRKHIIRLIVTSKTYRQSSAARKELAARDPDNLLLARQARFRLPGELIRDAALAAGGLLMDSVGGESVRPPQPEGVSDLQYSFKWTETPGQARYRRGLYIHTQRTAMYPLLMNFDGPDRTVACARRETSNTPLQSLNLMNDPVFVEMAQALAARLIKERRNAGERIHHAFRICYSRPPSPRERDLLASYLEKRKSAARNNPGFAQSLPAGGFTGVDPAEAAAWFGASRSLLNSDEFLTRE